MHLKSTLTTKILSLITCFQNSGFRATTELNPDYSLEVRKPS